MPQLLVAGIVAMPRSGCYRAAVAAALIGRARFRRQSDAGPYLHVAVAFQPGNPQVASHWIGGAEMQALVLERMGLPSLRDFPMTQTVGPRDVRIAVHTVGICGSDVHYYTCWLTLRRSLVC